MNEKNNAPPPLSFTKKEMRENLELYLSKLDESELHATIYAIHTNYIETHLQALTIEFVEALLVQLDNQKSEQARTS